MKNKLIVSAIVAIALISCSKNGIDNNGSTTATVTAVPASAVPAATTAAFRTEFGSATEVEWLRSNSSSFTVQFNMTSQRHSAGYDDGGLCSSHSVICINGSVPQVVLDAFRQQFATDSVYEWKLTNEGTWKAHFMRNNVKYEATFSASGTLLKFESA